MEKYYRKNVCYDNDTIKFQSLEWLDFNEQTIDCDCDSFGDEIKNEKYVIKSFGVTETGESVCMSIKDFTPFFYIKVPDSWNKVKVSVFFDNLSNVDAYFGSNPRPYNPLSKWFKYLLKDKCFLQRKKDFYGYHIENDNFLRLTFSNSEALRKFKYLFKSHNDTDNKTRIKGINFDIKLYEDNLDPILRLLHIKDIKPCGWITAKNIKQIKLKESRCQIELECHWQDIYFFDKHTNGRILQASFDIEVFSFDDSFPVPTVPQNVVTQIATTFKYTGDINFTMIHIVCLKNCSPVNETPGVETFLECYDTEKEVLLAWRKLITNMDPDIIYTYNGDTFDCNYLCVRSKIAKCENEFLNISKLVNKNALLKDASFGSSAHGKTDYKRMSIPGRINFDLYIFIFREYKDNNSYKLDDISNKYLGENKLPVSVTMIFDYFASGDPDKIKIIADYCIVDAKLPQQLADKLHILQANISMSNVTSVTFKMLIERGQQIKVFSQILKTTRKMNFLVPSHFGEIKMEDDDKLEGATVLSPKQGAYNKPVVVMDYKSLYPTIMMAHNLCYSTAWLSSDPPPNNSMNVFEWDEKSIDPDTKLEVIKHRNYKYVKPEIYHGVLPKILNNLAESRTYAKKKMSEAKNNGDLQLKEIYNKLQLAYKVSMNSIYGFLAAQMLTLKQVAGTVTAVGRQMIAQTKEFVEREYPKSQCIYGDTDSCFFFFETKASINFIKHSERINNQTVITEKDNEYLDKLKIECIKEAIEIGSKAAKEATKLFKEPIELEYEKVYWRMMMLSKKRYMGELYSVNPEKPDYFDSKGIVLNRRDNFPLVKKLYKQIIDILMEKWYKGIPEIKDIIHNAINSIINNNISIDDVIMTKAYKPPYKNNNLPQVVVAKKITERDPGNTPRSNDRMNYVFIDTSILKVQPLYMKVEDSEYAKQHNLPLDVEYYVNYMSKPLSEFLTLFIKDPEQLFRDQLNLYKRKRYLKITGTNKKN